jgi:hypothetical protein
VSRDFDSLMSGRCGWDLGDWLFLEKYSINIIAAVGVNTLKRGLIGMGMFH